VCIRSNQHLVVREDGKIHLETTFVSSLFKDLSNRDAAVVQDDKFLVERSKQMLDYDMVTELHLLNNQYHWCFQ
jgi:uridine kinase